MKYHGIFSIKDKLPNTEQEITYVRVGDKIGWTLMLNGYQYGSYVSVLNPEQEEIEETLKVLQMNAVETLKVINTK